MRSTCLVAFTLASVAAVGCGREPQPIVPSETEASPLMSLASAEPGTPVSVLAPAPNYVVQTAPPVCVDPPEPVTGPTDFVARTTLPALETVPGALVDGGTRLMFHPGGAAGTIRVIAALDAEDDDGTRALVRAGSFRVAVAHPSKSVKSGPRTLTSLGAPPVAELRIPTAELERYALATDYVVRADGSLTVQGVALVDAATSASVPGQSANVGLTATPGTCEEHALVRFGPFPPGMPSFKWPKNVGCSGERCIDVRFAFLQALHATWRMTQMMDVVAHYSGHQRDWAWSQPGADQNGHALSERTSPSYLFGGHSDDTFGVVRELFKDHLTVLREAHMDGIDLRLKCPSSDSEPGNLCFTTGTLAHHVVKGWINICPETWNRLERELPGNGRREQRQQWFHHVVSHELYHHHFVKIPGQGWKMVKDTLSHKHDTWCASIDTDQFYSQWGQDPFDARPRHLATYENGHGESCGHRKVAQRNVDSYNTFARIVGDMVWRRTLWSWPKLADPTPKPPTCVGGVGCLCEDTQGYYTPDGDYQDGKHCDDADGRTECVKTKFNASDTVGICTRCADERGPGCPCKGQEAPCDVGSCFGDDTNGTDAAWGQCYVEPPHWSCLADCEALLGTGAFCMTDHPERARCVPLGTSLPEASNCWWGGGHMDAQTLACTGTPECGPGSAQPAHSCASLGYPPYYVCDATGRCVVDL